MEDEVQVMDNVEAIIDGIASAGAVKGRGIIEGLDGKTRDDLFSLLRSRSDALFGKKVKAYIPGKKFPAISVTGSSCDLQCEHCNKRYLRNMVPALNPESLEKTLKALHSSGGTGALISGGSTKDGVVEMGKYYDTLRKIKNGTGLKLNMHTGLIDRDIARQLFYTGADTISLDLVGDDRIIKEIYHLDKTTSDYIETLKGFIDAGFTREQIAPHICIGLYKGEITGEYRVLDYLSMLDPRLIVFIILIPPREGDSTIDFNHVPVRDVGNLVAVARILYPEAEISIGCMRPGGNKRKEYDLEAFRAGITRIALPTKALEKYLEKNGYVVERMNNCCAIEVF
ncbi:MAG: radical SAM protein [Candidatus Hodarchaeota archaeon]